VSVPRTPRYRQFFAELKRRHVFRVAAVYGATAFVIIQAADVVFPRIPLPEWTVSLVVWLSLLGFPVALVLAWAYERTPEGVRATDRAATGELEAIASEPMRRRWPAGMAALAGIVLLGLGAWWALTRTGPGARQYDSIAVLPFADLAEGEIDSWFSDGLSDELISALAGVGDLKVAGRTSSYALREANLDLRTIGDTLGVDAVLEGSVRRSADRVRISVQLVDAATGYNLWNEEYDRDITDIFHVQEELAQSIVRALLPRLGGTPRELYRGGTEDLAAYELYRACRQKWYTRNHELLYQAIDDCEAAIARDSGFALAWSGLSDAIDALAYRDARVLHLIPRARMAAQRAVLLDPSLADGWASWGTLASEADRDWVTAELALRRAIELKPSNAYARAMLADLLRYRGRVRESIEEHRSARELDPLSPVIRGVLAISLGVVGEYPESRVLLEQNLREGVDEAAAHGFLLLWGPEYGLTGDEMAAHAIELVRILGATEPERAAVIGHAFASGEGDSGLRAQALAVADGIVSRTVLPLRQVASLYTRLGDPEAALARLEAADPSLDVSLNLVGVDPSLDPLRDDPRMQALTERLGLPNGYDPATDASAPGGVR
jgi:serine/threonine-protein kinase